MTIRGYIDDFLGEFDLAFLIKCIALLFMLQEPQLTACEPFDVYTKPFSL